MDDDGGATATAGSRLESCSRDEEAKRGEARPSARGDRRAATAAQTTTTTTTTTTDDKPPNDENDHRDRRTTTAAP